MTVFNTSYCSIDEAWGDLQAKPKKDPSKRKKALQDPICELYERKAAMPSYNETDIVRFANEYYDKMDKSRYQRNMRTQNSSQQDVEREPSPRQFSIEKDQSQYDVSATKRNKALFEKQFDVRVPALYDGSECPTISQEYEGHSSSSPSSSQRNQTFAENISSLFKGFVQQEEDGYGYDSDEDMIPRGILQPKYVRPEAPPQRAPDNNEEDRLPGSRKKSIVPEQIYDRYNIFDERSHPSTASEKPYGYDEMRKFQKLKTKYNNIEFLDLALYVISGIILIFLMEQFVRIGMGLQQS